MGRKRKSQEDTDTQSKGMKANSLEQQNLALEKENKMKSLRGVLLTIAAAAALGLSLAAQPSNITNQQQNQSMQGGQMQHRQMHDKGTNSMMQGYQKNM